MNKRIAKKVVSVVLALALLASVVSMSFTVSAADFTLTWPAVNAWGPEYSTPPAWANVADDPDDDQDVASITMQAILDEYDYQAEQGFDMGAMNGGVTAYNNMVNVQFENGDHTGNPWGQAGRRMGGIIAPYPGIAFSVKGDRAMQYGRIPIGNETTYTNGDVYIVQAVTDGFIVTNNTSGVTQHWGFTVGAGAPDEVKANIQYAYAAAAAGLTFGERVTLGYTDVNVTLEGDVYYQQIKSDAGESYIVAADDADEAYVVMGDVLTAWATTWTTESKFGVTGAPIGNAVTDENGVVTQEFEYATITVTPAAEEGAEPTVEIDYDIVQGDNVAVPMLDAGITHVTTPKAAISYGANADCVKDSGHGLAGANAALAAKGSEVVLSGANFDMMLEPSMGGTGSGDNGTQAGYADTDKSYHTMQVAIPEGATSFSTIIAMCDLSRNQTPAIQVPDDTFLYSMKAIDAEGNQLGDVVYSNGVNKTFVINSTKPENYAIEMAIDEIPDGAVAIEIYIETGRYARWDHVAFFNSDFVVPVTDEDVAAAKEFTKAVKLLNAADTDAVRELRDMYDDMSAVARGAATIYNDFAAIEADAQANASYTIFEAENAIGGNAPVTFFESATIDELNGDHQRNNPANYGGEGQDPLPEDAIITTACGGGVGQEITFTVYAPTAGARYLGISYATNDARPIGIKVVDADGVETAYPTLTGAPTGGWNVNYTYIYTTVELTAGENKIVLFGDGNWTPDFDCIAVEDTEIFATSATEGSIADEIASWSAKIDAEDLIALNKNIVTYDYGVIYGLDEDVVAGAEDDVMDGDKYTAKKVSFVEEAKDGVDVYKTFGLRMKNIGDHEPVVKFYVTYKVAGTEYTDNEYVTVYSDVVGAAAAATPDGE